MHDEMGTSCRTWTEPPSLLLYEIFEFFRPITSVVGATRLYGLLTLPAPHVVTAKDGAMHNIGCFYVVFVDENRLLAPVRTSWTSASDLAGDRQASLATIYQDGELGHFHFNPYPVLVFRDT